MPPPQLQPAESSGHTRPNPAPPPALRVDAVRNRASKVHSAYECPPVRSHIQIVYREKYTQSECFVRLSSNGSELMMCKPPLAIFTRPVSSWAKDLCQSC